MLTYSEKLKRLADLPDKDFAGQVKFVVGELTKLLGELIKHEFVTRFEL